MTTTRKYDPASIRHREDLAHELQTMLRTAGFEQVTLPGTNEEVWGRVSDRNADIRVLVYTTIEHGKARRCGKDAIRVCAVYKSDRDGKERGLAKAEKRVNRTGTIEAICERTLTRMRSVFGLARNPERCSCGAPKFKAKSDKHVCARLCWLSDEQLRRPAPRRSTRRGRRGWGRRSHTPAATTSYRSAVPAGAPLPASWENAPLAKQVAWMMAAGDTSGEVDWDRWADEQMGN